MGLQLRMTHSLGQRLVEVESRRADQAIVVGRASNAEVQIPSASIAKKHCLLFVHEGRWVVQDADSPTGTYLNGERLTEPAFVNSGDVIALGRGSNPPTLTVDPHSVGVSEEREEIAPIVKVPAAQQQGPWMPPAPPQAGAGMPPPLMPPQPMPAQGFVQEDDDNIFGAPAAAPVYGGAAGYVAPGSVPGYGLPAAPAVADEWGSASAAPAKPRRRVVKPKGNSGAMVAITAVISVVIVIGGGALIYHNYQNANRVEIIKPPAQAPSNPPPHKATSIFEEGTRMPGSGKAGAGNPGEAVVADASKSAPVVKTIPDAKPATATPAATPEMEPVVDKRREDPEWDAIESARRQDLPAAAINKFNDYKDRHPDSPNNKDIDKYIDESVDRLWWTRITDQFAERDEAQKQIASRKLDISQAKDPEFKKTLQAEIAKFTETVNRANAVIHDEMKFTGQVAPELYDPQALMIATKTRDEEVYLKWKALVLNVIKGSHGQKLPWRQR